MSDITEKIRSLVADDGDISPKPEVVNFACQFVKQLDIEPTRIALDPNGAVIIQRSGITEEFIFENDKVVSFARLDSEGKLISFRLLSLSDVDEK